MAQDFADAVKKVLAEQDEVSVILATGNSQLPFVTALHSLGDIEWSRINVFHMDEYRGMSDTHPASFRLWMQQKIVDAFHPKRFFGIRGDFDPIGDELARYSQLLESMDPAICVMGIGENGHLAFNDPPADFETTELIHVVDLDEVCRRQQVGEGHFATIADVPPQAVSLTIPALLRPRTVLVATPESRKAAAVKAALEGPISPSCPASILRRSPNATLYLDRDSAALL
ncbi:MAG: glucosamine-6-phosphate deaminase [Propionibacteriaceae bacterium]|nr:glucosamine-6-phosphate deaminase [Propionibacteriaceae bacterium]